MSATFDLNRRLAAEALGTLFLVATVVGSGIMATNLTPDPGLQLLANAIPTGAILYVLIVILGPVSGAHLNPAVSLGFALGRALPWRELAPYATAQVIGGLLGTALAHAMFANPLLQLSTTQRTGSALWLSEVVAAFGLMGAIMGGLAVAPRAVPALVGLYITAAYWFTASTSFANPAVAIARGFTDSFSGIRPVDLPGFILAECAGAALAVWVMGWLHARKA